MTSAVTFAATVTRKSVNTEFTSFPWIKREHLQTHFSGKFLLRQGECRRRTACKNFVSVIYLFCQKSDKNVGNIVSPNENPLCGLLRRSGGFVCHNRLTNPISGRGQRLSPLKKFFCDVVGNDATDRAADGTVDHRAQKIFSDNKKSSADNAEDDLFHAQSFALTQLSRRHGERNR